MKSSQSCAQTLARNSLATWGTASKRISEIQKTRITATHSQTGSDESCQRGEVQYAIAVDDHCDDLAICPGLVGTESVRDSVGCIGEFLVRYRFPATARGEDSPGSVGSMFHLPVCEPWNGRDRAIQRWKFRIRGHAERSWKAAKPKSL